MHPRKCARFILSTLLLSASLAVCQFALPGEPVGDVQSANDASDMPFKPSSSAIGSFGELNDAVQAAALRAWYIHWEPERSSISAIGDVELRHDKFLLRANQLRYDVKNNCVTAQGGATLLMGDELRLVSDFLSYNFDERRGTLTSVKAFYGVLSFAARRANMLGDSVVLEDGKVTTCDKAHPHYKLTVKRIEVVPGRLVTLDGLSGRIYGLRLPTLPKYRYRLGDGVGEKLPFKVYINSADGVYAGFNYSRPISGSTNRRPVMLAGAIGLSAKETWRGRLLLLKSWERGEARIGVARKDTVSDELAKRLFLDVLPELGIGWAYKMARHGFSLYGDISAGRYTERHVKRVSSPRMNIQLGLRNAIREDEHWRWSFDLLLRYAHYKSDELKLARLKTGVRGRIGHRVDGSIMLVHHIQSGRTPFEFDDVDIGTELRVSGHAWLVRDRWKLIYDLRCDASQWKMRDWSVGLVYRAHCVEWGLVYELARREVRLVVDLVGVTVPK